MADNSNTSAIDDNLNLGVIQTVGQLRATLSGIPNDTSLTANSAASPKVSAAQTAMNPPWTGAQVAGVLVRTAMSCLLETAHDLSREGKESRANELELVADSLRFTLPEIRAAAAAGQDW